MKQQINEFMEMYLTFYCVVERDNEKWLITDVCLRKPQKSRLLLREITVQLHKNQNKRKKHATCFHPRWEGAIKIAFFADSSCNRNKYYKIQGMTLPLKNCAIFEL